MPDTVGEGERERDRETVTLGLLEMEGLAELVGVVLTESVAEREV